MNYFKNLGKRLLYVVETIINWAIYLPIGGIIFVLEFLGTVVFVPLLWILAGTDTTNKVMDLFYFHSNDELWLREPGDNPEHFDSMIPIWAYYVQKHYLKKLIKDEPDI